LRVPGEPGQDRIAGSKAVEGTVRADQRFLGQIGDGVIVLAQCHRDPEQTVVVWACDLHEPRHGNWFPVAPHVPPLRGA